MEPREEPASAWPDLATLGWEQSSRTLLLWFQIVGKTRLALAPMTNHWWQVTQYVSARGLHTSPIPYDSGSFEVEFDFVAQRLEIRKSDGRTAWFPLEAGPVAVFYQRFFDALRGLDIYVTIYPKAVELVDSIQLDRDQSPRLYDPDWGGRFFS